MPLYEYTCESCGKDFEELVPASRSGDRIPCPGCGKSRTRRKLSSFSPGGGGKPSPSPGGGCAPSRSRFG